MERGPMILSAFFYNPQGDHWMSRRHPDAPGREIFELSYYQKLAAAAEAACLDAIFVADHVAMWDTYESNIAHYANARLEPITMLAALAAVTRHIGLIVTASASYSEPYNIARIFASLDHISKGRFGWNVVTSGMNEEAMNFSRDANIEHARRYESAEEFLDITKALWDSIEDDALLLDKKSGFFAEPARVHRINHTGKHFKVRGPLNVPRPPQGYPVIVQAGSSEDGKNLAAKHADLNFALVRTIEEAQRYRKDFDERLRRIGRQPGDLKVLPGILPIVARSRVEAQEKRDLLEALVLASVGVELVRGGFVLLSDRWPAPAAAGCFKLRWLAHEFGEAQGVCSREPDDRRDCPSHFQCWHRSCHGRNPAGNRERDGGVVCGGSRRWLQSDVSTSA